MPLPSNPKLHPNNDADHAVAIEGVTPEGGSCRWEPQHRETSGAGDLSKLFLAQTPIVFLLLLYSTCVRHRRSHWIKGFRSHPQGSRNSRTKRGSFAGTSSQIHSAAPQFIWGPQAALGSWGMTTAKCPSPKGNILGFIYFSLFFCF